MKLKCRRCGYEWDYKGDAFYASCPRCRTTVKTTKVIPPRKKEET